MRDIADATVQVGLTLYFAYGSNLNVQQFTRRCPGHRVVGRAVAHGYTLAFPRFAGDWQSAVAGIVPAVGQRVEGAVYAITDEHVRTLDVYEGIAAGHYQRGSLTVELFDGRRVETMTYFAHPQEGVLRPHPRYLQTIVQGARDHALTPAWLAVLEEMLAACAETPVPPTS